MVTVQITEFTTYDVAVKTHLLMDAIVEAKANTLSMPMALDAGYLTALDCKSVELYLLINRMS